MKLHEDRKRKEGGRAAAYNGYLVEFNNGNSNDNTRGITTMLLHMQ